MINFAIRPVTDSDRAWIARFTAEHWGSEQMVAHGSVFYISQLPGFIAEQKQAGQPDKVVGLLSYHISDNECEITSLDSLQEGQGIGTALIQAVKQAALKAGCRRLFLVTTNDNVHALGFYQRRGFVLVAFRRNAVNESRKIKPEIPLLGNTGIPIRDELELETQLKEAE